MASRKDEKERLRAERLAAERQAADAARRRLILGYAAAAILGAVVIGGVVIAIAGGGGGPDSGGACAQAHVDVNTGVTNDVPADCREGTEPGAIQQATLEIAAREAGCDLEPNLPDEGNSHVEPGTNVKYDTNPATSGDHVITTFVQADGAYREPVDELNGVHSLEHGRVAIQYSPKLSQADQLALKGLFDASPSGMLLFPNPDMPYSVAATAWTALLGCDEYEGQATLDALIDFRDRYRGQGPESVHFTP